MIMIIVTKLLEKNFRYTKEQLPSQREQKKVSKVKS